MLKVLLVIISHAEKGGSSYFAQTGVNIFVTNTRLESTVVFASRGVELMSATKVGLCVCEPTMMMMSTRVFSSPPPASHTAYT